MHSVVSPSTMDEEDRGEAKLLKISSAIHRSLGLDPNDSLALLRKVARGLYAAGNPSETVLFAEVDPYGARKSFYARAAPSVVTIMMEAETQVLTADDVAAELEASRPKAMTGINGRDSTEQQLRAAAGAAVRISGAGVNVVVSDISDEAIEKIANVVRFRSRAPQQIEPESAAIEEAAMAKDQAAANPCAGFMLKDYAPDIIPGPNTLTDGLTDAEKADLEKGSGEAAAPAAASIPSATEAPMSDPHYQTTLTNAEIERDDLLAAAAVEGRRDDPFLEPGDDPNPAPIEEPEPPTAPTSFMILFVRPRYGETAMEVIWTVGGGLLDPETLRVPPAWRSGYVVCEDARMAVVFEDKDKQRGVIRRGYDFVGSWRAACPDDFESRPGRQFREDFPRVPETLRAVYAKGQEDGRKSVVENVKRAIGADGSER